MANTRTVYFGLKAFISALAAILLFKLVLNDSLELYSTFFIYVADKVIDIFFSRESFQSKGFRIWGTLNGICGAVTCLVALGITFWTYGEALVVKWVSVVFRILFAGCIVSLLIRDAVQAIYYPLMRERLILKINSDRKN